MKKILIIHHGQGVGGGLIALIGLIKKLVQSNVVEIFSIYDGIAVEYLRKTGVKVIVPKSKFYKKFYSIFIHSDASYSSLIEEILKFKSLIGYFLSKYYYSGKELKEILQDFDLVYLNSTFISDWAFFAKKNNKKVIIHVREPLSSGFFGLRKNMLKNNISKYCDKIIAISKDNCQRVGLDYKTNIIYDPVVTEDRITTNRSAFSSNHKYFVYVGGESRIKGFEQLVNSLQYLRKDIKIFFLGGEVNYNNKSIIKKKLRGIIDPYSRRHENLRNKLKQSDKIIHIGLTDNVFDFYSFSLCLISPFSRPHASLPVLEAFSQGLPVIVSNVKGMDEIVNYRNGFFFQNGDPKSLAKRINEMSLLSYERYELMKYNSLQSYFKLKENEIDIQSIINTL